MPTNYPYGNNPALGARPGYDDFQVTSDPSNTPLSQAGQNGNRTHVQSHTDMGDAIEALEENASLKTHDHSGDSGDRARGARLAQANTHQNADTDASATAIHHTLGTGANQAAPGNHVHDYDTLVNIPLRRAVSTSLPSGVPAGTLVYETDTGCVRQLRGSAWVLTTLGRIPIIRLRNAESNQTIASGGTTLQWDEKEEDTLNYITATVAKTSPVTTVTLREPGLYRFDAALQWNPQFVPENATAAIHRNNIETDLKVTKFQKKGTGLLNPAGFIQTLTLSGHLRITAANQSVSVRCSYDAPASLFGLISSWFDRSTNMKGRLDILYVAP